VKEREDEGRRGGREEKAEGVNCLSLRPWTRRDDMLRRQTQRRPSLFRSAITCSVLLAFVPFHQGSEFIKRLGFLMPGPPRLISPSCNRRLVNMNMKYR
jgi:hypothetical protein